MGMVHFSLRDLSAQVCYYIDLFVLFTDDVEKSFSIQTSKIHGNGLFALRSFNTDDLLIEYKGELINKKQSDTRENYYKQRGINHIYMITMENGHIIDATMRESMAKYINHSCDVSAFQFFHSNQLL